MVQFVIQNLGECKEKLFVRFGVVQFFGHNFFPPFRFGYGSTVNPNSVGRSLIGTIQRP